MKKLFTFLLLAISFGAFAQNQSTGIQNHNPQHRGKVANDIPKPQIGIQDDPGYYLDYEGYDEFFFGQLQAYVLVGFNSSDTTTGTVRQAMVVFDTLVVTDSAYENFDFLDWTPGTFVRIDTVYVIIGQQNNSGDTAVFKLRINKYDSVTSTNGAYLNQALELWKDSVAIDTNLTADPSTAGFPIKTMKFVPRIVTGSPFAATFEYFGNPIDTAYLRYSYGTDATLCSNNQSPTIYPSELYPQAFYGIALGADSVGGTIPSIMLPRVGGSMGYYWYIDCDGSGDPYATPGDDASGFVASENFYQNWSIWAHVTLGDSLALTKIDEIDAKQMEVNSYPNPAKDELNVNFKLKQSGGHASLSVADVFGKEIITENLGNRLLGSSHFKLNTSSLANGVYTFTLNVEGTAVTRKFVVSH